MNNKYLEKLAEEKKKPSNWQVYPALGASLGSGLATGLVAKPLYDHVTKKVFKHVDSPESSSDLGTIKKMMRDNKMDTTFNLRSHNVHKSYAKGTMFHEGIRAAGDSVGPAFLPKQHAKAKDFILGVKKGKGTVNKDIIMHELGHAKDFATHTKLKHFLGGKFSTATGAASALALTNKKTENYATPLAVASVLPQLRNEAAANYHAYKGIQAHKGTAAARSFAKKLLPSQMGSYAIGAAIPVAATYGATKILQHYRKHTQNKT